MIELLAIGFFLCVGLCMLLALPLMLLAGLCKLVFALILLPFKLLGALFSAGAGVFGALFKGLAGHMFDDDLQV